MKKKKKINKFLSKIMITTIVNILLIAPIIDLFGSVSIVRAEEIEPIINDVNLLQNPNFTFDSSNLTFPNWGFLTGNNSKTVQAGNLVDQGDGWFLVQPPSGVPSTTYVQSDNNGNLLLKHVNSTNYQDITRVFQFFTTIPGQVYKVTIPYKIVEQVSTDIRYVFSIQTPAEDLIYYSGWTIPKSMDTVTFQFTAITNQTKLQLSFDDFNGPTGGYTIYKISPISATYADQTPPDAPTLIPVYDIDTNITGLAEPNCTVKLKLPDNSILTTTAGEDGSFSVPIPEGKLVAGDIVSATAIDGVGNISRSTTVTVLNTLPPAPPTVNPVTDISTVITGEAEPNSLVKIKLTDKSILTTTAGEDGSFSVTVSPDKLFAGDLISVTSSNAAGKTSTPTTVEVIKSGFLSFNNVPDSVSFESTEIKSTEQIVRRNEATWNLSVIDTRKRGGKWLVTASIDSPLTSATYSEHTMPNALVFIDNENNLIPLSKTPVKVFDYTTEIGSIIPITWDQNKGILIKTDFSNVYAESYSTTINWTLIDAP